MTVEDLLDCEIDLYTTLPPDILFRINTDYYIKIDLESNMIDLYNNYRSIVSYKLKL